MNQGAGSVRLDQRGRLVLPAELRRRLGFEPGDLVHLSEESDGSLRIQSRRIAARALIGLAKSDGRSALDDLAADRLDQAAAEQAAADRIAHAPSKLSSSLSRP